MAVEPPSPPQDGATALPAWLSAARRAGQPRRRLPTLPRPEVPLDDGDGALVREGRLAPAPPWVIMARDACAGGPVSASTVAALTRTDRGLAERTLAIIGSAAFGVTPTPIDIRSAISRLGIAEVARVLLSVAVVGSLRGLDAARAREHWAATLIGASLAVHLQAGQRGAARGATAGELWLGSALWDLGRLVSERLSDEQSSALALDAAAAHAALGQTAGGDELSRAALLGWHVAAGWHLPELVVAACHDHDVRALEAGAELRARAPLTALLAGTARLATLGRGDLEPLAGERLRHEACALLGISTSEALALMHRVVAARDEAARLGSYLAR
jgi:HD-like signal output (HDOD) protein